VAAYWLFPDIELATKLSANCNKLHFFQQQQASKQATTKPDLSIFSIPPQTVNSNKPARQGKAVARGKQQTEKE